MKRTVDIKPSTWRSVRRAKFRRQLQSLPPEIQQRAREAYHLFLQNPSHPSFRRRIIESTRHWERPHWEFRITRAGRLASLTVTLMFGYLSDTTGILTGSMDK